MKQKPKIKAICEYCGQAFEAKIARARWCSSACKQAAYRKRRDKQRQR